MESVTRPVGAFLPKLRAPQSVTLSQTPLKNNPRLEKM